MLSHRIAWQRLSCRLIHGDPGPGNTIFEDQEAHLIDFDDARLGYPLFDQARAVAEYAVLPSVGPNEHCEEIEMNFVAEMIARGCALRNPKPAELEAWSPAVGLSLCYVLIAMTDLDWEIYGLSEPRLVDDAEGLEALLSRILAAISPIVSG